MEANVPDPSHFVTGPDPAPDLVLFVIEFQDANKKFFF